MKLECQTTHFLLLWKLLILISFINFCFLIDEKIGTPHSKSPPAAGCETPQPAHTRSSCKSKTSKGSGG